MRHILLLTLSALLFVACNSSDPKDEPSTTSAVIVTSLDQNWEFCQADKNEWLNATVPGCVHTDLITHGRIEDPFYRLNEHDVQWIDKKDWMYKTTFNVTGETLSKNTVELTFEGLDTYSEVKLNGTQILTTDNMFRTWNVDCKKHLKLGENQLEVTLFSPINKGIELYDSLSYRLPVSDNDLSEIGGVGDKQVSIFVRKAGYHFGWDWGPRLVTSGIWKPVYITAYDEVKLDNVHIRQLSLNDEEAKLQVTANLDGSSDEPLKIEVSLEDKIVASATSTGETSSKTEFTIDSPKLWWPNGAGDQALYPVTVKLYKGESLLDQSTHNIGLRKVEVVQEADSLGQSFYFKVNDTPLFMKGANYIPQDVFLDRVSVADYERVIKSAVDANMNMLRVWGGGIYEKDIFYNLCDQHGILVWQDFMFACAMFPGDSAFLQSVTAEAKDNVIRLRNHPCIAMWCGNNEILSAWNNWGWKGKVTEEQGADVAEAISKAYQDIFHEVLPAAVESYDPDRFYWASSPQASPGVPESLTSGDKHYWDVWWGKKPFEFYEKVIPRFMSEFGFQAFPDINTVNKYAIEEDWDIESEVMRSHQRSSIGNVTIKEYMLRDYNEPKDFPMFLYVNHVLQGEGIKIGIEAHRRNMPYCMGSLYWQIDDCWPVASWSSTDYFGRWKAVHYRVRDSFKPIIISSEVNESVLSVTAVSDELETKKGKYSAQLISFTGETLIETAQDIDIKANSTTSLPSINIDEFTRGFDIRSSVLVLSLTDENGNEIDRSLRYLMKPKDLNLATPTIITNVSKGDSTDTITISVSSLAKNVYFNTPVEGHFSDNYFDMLPGEERVVEFIPEDPKQHLDGSLSTITLEKSY